MSAAQWVTNKGTAAGCCIFRLLASRGGGSLWSTIRAWYSCHRSILLPVADNRYPEMPAHSRSFRHHSLSQEESCQYSSISILPYSILMLWYNLNDTLSEEFLHKRFSIECRAIHAALFDIYLARSSHIGYFACLHVQAKERLPRL